MADFPPFTYTMKDVREAGAALSHQLVWDDESAPAIIRVFAIAHNWRDSHGYSRVSRRFYRSIGAEPAIREDGTHTNVNETIDVSVFDRWRTDDGYRPLGIVEWANRERAEPETITTSVRADTPSEVAPD